MPRLDDQIRTFIGMETDLQLACDAVEAGAVRRYAQAIMDIDPIYMRPEALAGTRYARPVAPPLFPNAMLRLPFGERDLVSERAEDPHFDGAVGSSTMGLPPLPLVGSPLLNGGTEVEMYRLAEHGEQVWLQSRYLDIYERESSKGVMLMVVIETDFLDARAQADHALPQDPDPPLGAWTSPRPAAELFRRRRRGLRACTSLRKGPLTTVHLMRWSAAMENWHKIHYDQHSRSSTTSCRACW